MKRENFYRRDPSKALSGMIGLSLEERGVLSTVVELTQALGGRAVLEQAFVASWCGVSTRRYEAIEAALIERGALVRTETDGEARLVVVAPPVSDPARPSISAAWRATILERCGGVCSYCPTVLTSDDPSAPSHFHCDHVVPWSAGGRHELENLVGSCRACNISKGSKSLLEWQGRAS